jgi:molecular chaperone GrpE|tara:strand:+ start:778 stop:1347 length:570 start_codon:yes stop_codon:yes gene_type:complete
MSKVNVTDGNDATDEIQMNPEESNEELDITESSDLVDEELDKFSAIEEELKIANDKYLRLYSEFENFRRRTAKEKLELISTASADLLTEIIPVLDDFGRAIKTNEETEDILVIKEGMILVHNKFDSILKSKGLVEMNSLGKEFNIDEHEALTKIPATDKKLRGKVVDVIEKGYKLKDKIVRYAKVVVGE